MIGNQFFNRRRRDFADPGRCVRFWSAEQKAAPDVPPIEAHGLEGCCSVLRARGSGRQRDTPASSERGGRSPRHQANCTLLIVISVTVEPVNSSGDLRIRMDSGQEA
jgi:hypothetical protein